MEPKILYVHVLLLYINFVDSSTHEIFNEHSILKNTSTDPIRLFEGEFVTVKRTLQYSITNTSFKNRNYTIKCWMDDAKVGFLKNWTDIFFDSSIKKNNSIQIEVTMAAKRLGGSQLFCEISIRENQNKSFLLFQDILDRMIVMRESTIPETVFRIVVTFFVIFITFVMGCGLDRNIILKHLKRPISPAIGFICQFLFMPIISFSLAKLTHIDNAFGFGLLTIGCSPGGGASNIWTVLFGGDLNLSMTMTFISSCTAIFMMPFWLFVFGRFFLEPSLVKIPYTSIGLNLLQIVIPAGLGMLFRWKFEKKAILLTKKVKIMGLLFIIFIITFGTYANLYIYKLMGDYPLLLPIGASLPWLGFLFGFILSVVTRRSREEVIAIAIETGFQNIGIAILILKFSMSQPEGDLGATMPIIVALFTPLPLYIGLIFLMIKRKYCNKKKDLEILEISPINHDQKIVLLEDEI